MAYNPPTDGECAPGKPIRGTLFTRLRDSLLATLAGDPLAPAISPAALRWKYDDIYYGTVAGGNIAGSNGSFTWTCPAGVTSILIEAIGAGGGGGGGRSAAQAGAAGADGTSVTSFGGVTYANPGTAGGTGGNGSGGSAGTGGAAAGAADLAFAGSNGTAGANIGAGGATSGGRGGSPILFPGFHVAPGGLPLVDQGRTPAATYPGTLPHSIGYGFGLGGLGAGTGGFNSGDSTGGSGGQGSYGRKVLSVLPGTGYAVLVGAGGAGGRAGAGGTGGAQATGPAMNIHQASPGAWSGTSGLLRIWYTY